MKDKEALLLVISLEYASNVYISWIVESYIKHKFMEHGIEVIIIGCDKDRSFRKRLNNNADFEVVGLTRKIELKCDYFSHVKYNGSLDVKSHAIDGEEASCLYY